MNMQGSDRKQQENNQKRFTHGMKWHQPAKQTNLTKLRFEVEY
jgi:hypothetical protein